MNPAIPLLEAAREVEDVLSALGLEGVIIGGMAVFRWGEPRATRDVDFTVLCPFGEEPQTIDAILSRLRGRIDDAREFALANRVLLLSASNGRPVDVALGAIAFEARAVARGSPFAFVPGTALRTCSAEDLVVMKAFAGRQRDLDDVAGIIQRQSGNLDWKLVESELKPLLEVKEDTGLWQRLLAMKARTA